MPFLSLKIPRMRSRHSTQHYKCVPGTQKDRELPFLLWVRGVGGTDRAARNARGVGDFLGDHAENLQLNDEIARSYHPG